MSFGWYLGYLVAVVFVLDLHPVPRVDRVLARAVAAHLEEPVLEQACPVVAADLVALLFIPYFPP